ITDQERTPMHWPAGWAAQNLPNRQRLLAHGLSFENAFCSTAMCSPSRSTFFTGKFPAEHGVVSTLIDGGPETASQPQLPLDEQNMATMLRAAGYRVHYRGKWHMSKGSDGGSATPAGVARYGFAGWRGPDYGGDIKPESFGGGCANHDGATIAQAVDFLTNEAPRGGPFALIVSLANPHDILSYPQTWNQRDGNCDNYGSAAPGAFQQGIGLPPSYRENLRLNHKPTAHAQTKMLLAGGLGLLPTRRDALDYTNFYAFLHTLVDAQLGQVLDALDADERLRRDTVVFRISDHGEMGMSHGGLRQKAFNAYEETLRVPLIVSNPTMFPRGARTQALASLVDLMPTMASLVKVPGRGRYTFRGADLMPVIVDAVANPTRPTVSTQDSVLFTFDEDAGVAGAARIVREPYHIRAVRDHRWKYAVYFDPAGRAAPQHEMYDLHSDPNEMRNLAVPAVPGFNPAQMAVMSAKLSEKMRQTHTTPKGAVLL
ncbi:sulfatase-like hydrolase/transferase, partial [Gordonia sp. (in: high G+C Gram-positive bacteria)]